ncbi:YihY/virulence factor BrkB family protein [Agromyces binzhouensis]|uniref:YihY/virulence factor BrkB family protein n=1 Tax=Agromyces binzhouensis TaxID=1817495 RepID=A0A4Q2JXN0_9MICO|nr:YihY/virulence factor BrkB family protein [Agromyces binzhouensis]RXZ51569.1 YihY/virulence factor BrkB family protein [Agromyces binzhouensis]
MIGAPLDHDAPVADPRDPRKPSSPFQITRRAWRYLARRVFREFIDDECLDTAAALTFWGTLSVFPGLLAVTSLLALIGQGGAIREILGLAQQVAPGPVLEVVEEPLRAFAGSRAATIGFLTGLVIALWSASGYVAAFTRAMNRILEIEEGRPFWKLRPFQLLITVGAILLVTIVAVILVVSGPVADAVGEALGVGATLRMVWDVAKWPLLGAVVVMVVALLYYATPNARQPRFRWISLGALIAIVLMLVASGGFALYVANFSNYDRTYGSLAGIVVFLLWLWITNAALLLGAEFNAELERTRQLQAGIPAEERLRMPPRGTRSMEKAAERHRRNLELGRRIREPHDTEPDHAGERGEERRP